MENAAVVGGDRATDLVALGDTLDALARLDPRKVQVVEIRFFSGLSVEETAGAHKVSPITVMGDTLTNEQMESLLPPESSRLISQSESRFQRYRTQEP